MHLLLHELGQRRSALGGNLIGQPPPSLSSTDHWEANASTQHVSSFFKFITLYIYIPFCSSLCLKKSKNGKMVRVFNMENGSHPLKQED